MDNRPKELLELLGQQFSHLPETQLTRIGEYYARLLTANEQQNLTRLIGPQEFIDGHLIDVLELLRSGFLAYPALDIGSGGGVPGLLAAILDPQSWVLSDSEGRKAAFLSEVVTGMGLQGVSVTSQRAESYLAKASVEAVTARAVGPLERIYSWIRNCSTWNTLVLLKGPRWEDEWAEYSSGRHRGELVILGRHDYVVGAEAKKRVIVQIGRRPKESRQRRS